jgi:hypothetical protein
VAATLAGAGGQSGTMAYRELSSGCREFITRVAGFAAGSHVVTVQDQDVGPITVGADGTGELVYDTASGTMPAGFPALRAQDTGNVAGMASGLFEDDCPAVAEICAPPANSNGNDDGDPNGDDRVTLTLVVTAPETTDSVQVVGLVDAGPVPRADVTRWDFSWNYAVDFNIGVFEFARGTEITLLARENDGGITSSGYAPLQRIPSQFSEWSGDLAGAVFTDDPGTVVFTMDGDRTVEAIFAPMHLVLVRVVGSALLDIEIDTQRLTIPPVIPQPSFGGSISNFFGSTEPAIVRWGYHNDGTTMTLTIHDDPETGIGCDPQGTLPCWRFQSWTGCSSGGGSDKVCVVSFAQDSNPLVTLQDIRP